ncbi:hypothetical protein LXL04_020329 [Taraxacum kok-saghyz]
MMKKSLDKHHDDSANEISSSSKIDQKLCFKITSLTTAISVGSTAAQKRKQNAVSVGKERREALFRTKRLCRAGVSTDTDIPIDDNDMMIEEEQSILESQTTSAVQELNLAITFQGKGAVQKKVNALRELRRLLSKSEFPPIETAIKSGVIPLLAQCLSFGSQDEQLLEAAWCLTNIAIGKPEETKALLPVLPLLIAHIGEKSSVPVAEQCAWAIGNVAGEGDELRQILISQGALLPLAKMMLPNKGSTVRTATWALSNLIKVPDPKAAIELIKVDGVWFYYTFIISTYFYIIFSDDELATEIAWVVVYLSALSIVATSVLVKPDVLQLLVLRSLGNLIAGDAYTTNAILVMFVSEKLVIGVGYVCNPMVFARVLGTDELNAYLNKYRLELEALVGSIRNCASCESVLAKQPVANVYY